MFKKTSILTNQSRFQDYKAIDYWLMIQLMKSSSF